jgi:hypothetical protein
MRLRTALAAVAAAAALLAGGCGIPDHTDVVTVGPGRPAGQLDSDTDDASGPPVRSAATESSEFVTNYLQAAAASDPETSIKQVRDYIDEDHRDTFKPTSNDIKVIRLTEPPLADIGNPQVTLKWKSVGTLTTNGVFVPSADPDQLTVETMEISNTKDGWFVTSPPVQGLLLDEAKLDRYYGQHAIYYWNEDFTGLVPDVRYIAKTVRRVQWPTLILNWLAAGVPAKWISDGVHSLNQGASAPDNVPAIDNGKLTITLGAAAIDPAGGGYTLERLRDQLQWSLRNLGYRVLELRIGHESPVFFSDDNYLTANPGYQADASPQRFAMYNGQIHPLVGSGAVPVLQPEANKGLKSATIRRSGPYDYAAVVTADKTPLLKVGAAPAGGQTGDLHVVAGLPGNLGYPVWASLAGDDTANAVGLIIANGSLYSFAADGKPARPIDAVLPAPVTSVSVAPDGRRVALTAGGKLYRTVLTTNGDQVGLGGTMERVQPRDMTEITAVAWGAEGSLTFAGQRADHRVTIRDVSIDGSTQQNRLEADSIGSSPVTYLTTDPISPLMPLNQVAPASCMYGNVAYDLSRDTDEIKVSALATPPATPPAGPRPVYPFFLY